MAIPAASPWLVSELGEALCTVVAPPPYSYDPNGSDLPRDCRVLQYYFNLGVQFYHQSCWQQQVFPSSSPDSSYQHYPPYLSSQDPPLHAAPQSFPETSRGSHQPPSAYPESTRAADGQTEGLGVSAPSVEGPSSSAISPAPAGSAPSTTLLYPDQTPLHPPPPLLHLPYEAPPHTAYLPAAPPPPHPTHLPHHSSYHACLPSSTHWGALPSGGHAPRVYCPAPSPAHVVGYITAPPTHHAATHYIPPTM